MAGCLPQPLEIEPSVQVQTEPLIRISDASGTVADVSDTLFTIQPPGSTTSTKESGQCGPTEFALHQNFPNPFNPSTTISYALPEKVFVTISIYNIRGEEVKRLVNRYVDAGNHQVAFDATGLPSGTYFVKMASGEFVQMRKLIFMK